MAVALVAGRCTVSAQARATAPAGDPRSTAQGRRKRRHTQAGTIPGRRKSVGAGAWHFLSGGPGRERGENVVSETPKTAGTRKSRGSREKIVTVALREFSGKGLSGARVDRIARLAKTSKNMIYYHFGSKEGLYQEVMQLAYAGIRQNERQLNVETVDPVQALQELVAVSFDYHCRNEMFVRLVMSENMNRAKHLKVSKELKAENWLIIDTLNRILQKGKDAGAFRPDIDPVHLHLTISGFGFHFVSNRYTFEKLFDLDMTSKEALARRRTEVIDLVLRWVKH